jgi:biotin carboxyl carrier protein
VQYDIEAGGRLRHVSVARSGDGFAVRVDDRLHFVDAERIDALTLSLIVDSRVPEGSSRGLRRAYDAVVPPGAGRGRAVVRIGAVPVPLSFDARRRPDRASGDARSGPPGIVAPMPGKIVRILVELGQAVAARQPVVVVEAMKMENALRADRDGTVAEIHVREGMSVEAGALLVVIQ